MIVGCCDVNCLFRAVPGPWEAAPENCACFCVWPLGSLVSAPGHEFCIQFANWNHLVIPSNAEFLP